MSKRRHSTYIERKVWRQNKNDQAACKESHDHSVAGTRPSAVRATKTKYGVHISRSDTEQVKINMRVASSRGSGRKVGMPKMPWDEKDERSQD